MGHTTKPAYRVEYVVDRGYWTPCAWQTKYDGRATAANLEKHVQAVEASTQPSGVNAHLGATKIHRARLIRQASGEIVAEYTGASYRERVAV